MEKKFLGTGIEATKSVCLSKGGELCHLVNGVNVAVVIKLFEAAGLRNVYDVIWFGFLIIKTGRGHVPSTRSKRAPV